MPKIINNIEEIMSLYESGVSSTELSLKYGISRTTMPKIYKRKYGIDSMLPNQGNIRYFQNLDTKLKAYFLGFITADGCLTNGNRLIINIQEDDRIILDTLREEIGCENPIYNTPKKIGKNQVTFALNNDLLYSDLESYGLGPKKSLTMTNIIVNIPIELRPSFILGYLDGDGWISNSKVRTSHTICHVGFCGTKEFLLGIVDEIKPDIFRIKKDSKIHSLEFGSSKQEVIKYFHYLYNDQPFYLKRKYNKFIDYFNTINYVPIK